MELKNEVCSLESAIKLEKLGVPQKSLFYWSSTKGKNDFDCYYQNDQGALDEQICGPLDTYSAFTVAELGDMLPEMVDNLQILTWKKTWREQMTYFCEHRDNVFSAETEAEARAKMLIYLLENKLI